MTSSDVLSDIHCKRSHLVLWWNTLDSNILQTEGMWELSRKTEWTFILGSLPDTEPVNVWGKFYRLVLCGMLELKSVVSIKDGLYCLSEMIVSIAENGSSGIGTKVGIKKYTLLNNTETVDILGGKSVESSRGKGVMFWR